MSMLTFYINRAGDKLSKTKLNALESEAGTERTVQAVRLKTMTTMWQGNAGKRKERCTSPSINKNHWRTGHPNAASGHKNASSIAVPYTVSERRALCLNGR